MHFTCKHATLPIQRFARAAGRASFSRGAVTAPTKCCSAMNNFNSIVLGNASSPSSVPSSPFGAAAAGSPAPVKADPGRCSSAMLESRLAQHGFDAGQTERTAACA